MSIPPWMACHIWDFNIHYLVFQLAFAMALSVLYSVLMMLVLIGLIKLSAENGFCSITTIFICAVVGMFLVTALLHPKVRTTTIDIYIYVLCWFVPWSFIFRRTVLEIASAVTLVYKVIYKYTTWRVSPYFTLQECVCVLHGFVYFLAIPSMSMLLMIYSLGNLNDVSWGTRDGNQSSPNKGIYIYTHNYKYVYWEMSMLRTALQTKHVMYRIHVCLIIGSDVFIKMVIL